MFKTHLRSAYNIEQSVWLDSQFNARCDRADNNLVPLELKNAYHHELNGGVPALTDNSFVNSVYDGINNTTILCHGLAAAAGWWVNPVTLEPLELTRAEKSEKLLLIVTEITEGFEGLRKGLMDDKLPHREMLEVELADALIRIHDTAGALGLDLAGAVIEKLAFNSTRQDHQLANRVKPGGKIC